MLDVYVDYLQKSRVFRAQIAGCHGHWGAWEGSPLGYGRTHDEAVNKAEQKYADADVITPGRHCGYGCKRWDPF